MNISGYSGAITTYDNTPTDVLPGPYTLPDNASAIVDVMVISTRVDRSATWAWHMRALFLFSAGTAEIQGSPHVISAPPQLGTAAWVGAMEPEFSIVGSSINIRVVSDNQDTTHSVNMVTYEP